MYTSSTQESPTLHGFDRHVTEARSMSVGMNAGGTSVEGRQTDRHCSTDSKNTEDADGMQPDGVDGRTSLQASLRGS